MVLLTDLRAEMQQPWPIQPLAGEDRATLSRHFLGRDGHFGPYFEDYHELLAQSHFSSNGRQPGPGSAFESITPDAVIWVSNTLKGSMHKTKGEIVRALLADESTLRSERIAESAIHLAIRAMLMVNAAGRLSRQPTNWDQDQTLGDFASYCFPVRQESSSTSIKAAMYDKKSMKAWKLRSRQHIHFRPTNNLTEHLLYDQKGSCLYLFHQTEVLKAFLQRFRRDTDPLSIGIKQSLERGSPPPQLLVETLHSLQDVLFHPADTESTEILSKLVENEGFDQQCTICEGFEIFQELPRDFEYKYWGERIANLHRLATSRRPRNALERWVDRQTTDGNALFVALMALLISIIVGIISILLSAAQLWVGYMAWKHPVK